MNEQIISHLKAFRFNDVKEKQIGGNLIVVGSFRSMPFSVVVAQNAEGKEYRVFRGHDAKNKFGATNMLSQLYKIIQRL